MRSRRVQAASWIAAGACALAAAAGVAYGTSASLVVAGFAGLGFVVATVIALEHGAFPGGRLGVGEEQSGPLRRFIGALFIYPPAAAATYLLSTRFWGNFGWEDVIAFSIFSGLLSALVEGGRHLLRNRGRRGT